MGQDLETRLIAVGRRYGLESMYVFGSRAEEIAGLVAGTEAHTAEGPAAEGPAAEATSDVDIAVQPHRDLRLDAKDRVALTLELESLFRVNRVDLVVLPEANALLAAEVVRGELLYAEDADAEAESQLYYLRRAGDLAPFYREQWRELMGSEL
jgi:predicted nucleotidyltransferase